MLSSLLTEIIQTDFPNKLNKSINFSEPGVQRTAAVMNAEQTSESGSYGRKHQLAVVRLYNKWEGLTETGLKKKNLQ